MSNVESEIDKKYIVILGGSNSILTKGLQFGIVQEAKKKLPNIEIKNLALGGCGSCQRLLELIRHKNSNYFKNLEAIIIETNVNDIQHSQSFMNLDDVLLIYDDICRIISSFNCKVINLVLPFTNVKPNVSLINNYIISKSNEYGFNVIDIHQRFIVNKCLDFFGKYDHLHPLQPFMMKLGQEIVDNISSFHIIEKMNCETASDYVEIYPNDLLHVSGDTLLEVDIKNSWFSEKAFKLSNTTKLKFPQKYYGYKIIGALIWNHDISKYDLSHYVYENHKHTLVKGFRGKDMIFQEIRNNFIVDDDTYFYYNNKCLNINERCKFVFVGDNPVVYKERYSKKGVESSDAKRVSIVCFLANKNIKANSLEMNRVNLIKDLIQNLVPKFDFSYLVPDPLYIMESIIEFNKKKDSKSNDKNNVKNLQKKIEDLEKKVRKQKSIIDNYANKRKLNILLKIKKILKL